MNFIFLSPNFPVTYYNFTKCLKNNGVTTLGIGDQAYDSLSQECRDSLVEYYKVNSLENYDEVYRACAYFAFKYGRIDWLESNNEYWLLRDAQLRTDFNVKGLNNDTIDGIKYKSKMKEYYAKAGVKTARYHLVTNLEEGLAFIKEVGYPVIVKPDNGVGAAATYKLKTEEDVINFYNELPEVQYIMEEFIDGEVNSYDAIIDSKGQPLFETGNVTPLSIMDVVNNNDSSIFYIRKELPEDVRKAGRATVASFGVKSRFVHFEFFRLLSDYPHLGKKGDVIALEVNMRPSGGVTPDMINFAHSTDVYKIWADMIAFDRSTKEEGKHAFCAFIGRRDGKNYVMNHEDILAKYGSNLRMNEPVAKALSGAMGDYMYLATFDTEEQLNQYYEDTSKCW